MVKIKNRILLDLWVIFDLVFIRNNGSQENTKFFYYIGRGQDQNFKATAVGIDWVNF